MLLTASQFGKESRRNCISNATIALCFRALSKGVSNEFRQVLSLQRSLREVTLGVPNLERLTLTGCYNLTDEKLIFAFSEDNYSLTELNLSMCKQITDRSILKIAQHLKFLQSLDLGGCSNITNSLLTTVRLQLKKLKRLNLRSCRNITDSGIAKLCGQTLSNCVDSTHCINEEPNKVLEYLGLQDCQKLTDEALRYISVGFSNMKSINLSFCSGITDVGLKHLSTISQLNELNLRSCVNITDAGIKYLSDAGLKLRSLDISFCDKIGDQSLSYISQGLCYLHSLSLNSCSITDDGLMKIAQTLNDLSMLNIGQCNRITDKGLNAIAESCRSLRTIDIYGCTRITNIDVHTMLAVSKPFICFDICLKDLSS
ncbi:F-box/LRR-repeat protein 14-like protein [Dinothrombium tinctorium]|uniref:F-box/LRR-repeat protein 14-like protein n=1 Tax=Dinothrombium tinctorium TaxID=1965070 RepID=A0A3S3QWK5_9ACAR|nr:F-box/LRR-repeat protein 14-like protein [Dinothrombium tinctorium]